MDALAVQQKERIQAIDVLRGLVMVIMALDHVRDFFHISAVTDYPTNLATATPALFFTRWITHFCAPVFVFLSGASAYLTGLRRSKHELSLFLIKRGIWLIFAELVIISFALTFDPLFHTSILQVIWAIGWSMLLLGLLVKTSYHLIVIIGFIIFFGHNVSDFFIVPKQGAVGVITNVLLTSPFMFYTVGNHFFAVIYAILPWASVMFLGYGMGYFYTPAFNLYQRKKVLLYLGTGITFLFIVLRSINHYGDPNPWLPQKTTLFTFLSFINTTKYPPSLHYLCMTIGPSLIFLALIENSRSKLNRLFITYGRVPFLYYVLHFYLIHFICVLFFFLSGYSMKNIVDPNTPFFFRPATFGFSLWVVYGIWLFVITVLYWPCKWFYRYKRMHNQWWLSYV